jgi:hypothetical protein
MPLSELSQKLAVSIERDVAVLVKTWSKK